MSREAMENVVAALHTSVQRWKLLFISVAFLCVLTVPAKVIASLSRDLAVLASHPAHPLEYEEQNCISRVLTNELSLLL